jgi:hypothetical protein
MSHNFDLSEQAETVVAQTRHWVESFIVEYNICPFAKRELERGSIRYAVISNSDMEKSLEALAVEFSRLNNDTDIETTLFIFAAGVESFDGYLDFVDIANQLLLSLDYEGVYQLATFHPEYCFEGEPTTDPANYTNRSPYPMLHIIREQSLERSLQFVGDPEAIPERNIAFTRDMGMEKLQAILAFCKS